MRNLDVILARLDSHREARGESRSEMLARCRRLGGQLTEPENGEEAAAVSEGAAILSEIEAFVKRFVVHPSEHARIAHALWIAHTHAMSAWESTPRIAFLSPEPGSGKTRALEVSELLVPRPIEAINATPAYLFRKISDPDGSPTILYDEIDTLFGPKAKDNEEIRAIMNAGHRRGAVAGRCVVRGKTVETEELPAYCAVALAGLGGLPDTILTRAVVVRMRRRGPGEKVESFRRRMVASEGHGLRDRLAAWVQSQDFVNARPAMPEGIEDRAADVFEALLAVAEAAGGDWPSRARAAAVALVAAARESTPSLGVRLLTDLRQVFGEADAMSTEAILQALCALEEAPWGDLRGKPLDSRRLAGLLKPYGVQPKTMRVGTSTPRGYTKGDLWDAWARYVPPLEPPGSATSATGAAMGICPNGNVADDVADVPPVSATEEPSNSAAVAAVVDVADLDDCGPEDF